MDTAVVLSLMILALKGLVSCHKVCFIGTEYDPQSGKPPRWFLPYKDPCKCTAIRLGGMNIPASSYLQGAPYYLDDLILTEDPEEIQTFFGCATAAPCSPGPLGLESGAIPDSRMTSSLPAEGSEAPKGRLNANTFWEPQDVICWIEVDLVDITMVTGVITQGDGESKYVMKYEVMFKQSPSSIFEYVKEAGSTKVFDANTDATTAVTNTFNPSIMAAIVRIVPTEYEGNAILRLELLGC